MASRRDFLMQAAVGVGVAAAAQGQSPEPPPSRASSPKEIPIPNTDLVVSRIAYGCASFGNWERKPNDADTVASAARIVRAADEHGITLFDHADVYGYGSCEAVFGEVLKQSPGLRRKLVIQSKTGIHLGFPLMEPAADDPSYLDFSRAHLLEGVEGSLKRLGTDHLDILLLHRPDALVDPAEVAQAFDELHRAGKVRYFGVSNHTASQIELLRRYVRQPLVVNQVELSLAQPRLITDGLDANQPLASRLYPEYTGVAGTLDYCRLHGIQVQAYHPLSKLINPPANAPESIQQTAQLLSEIGRAKGAAPSAVALAWLLRHPAGIVPITGAMNPAHLAENCRAVDITLSRPEWYRLMTCAAGATMSKVLL